MSTALDPPWRERAAELADTLTRLGKLTNPAWQAAVQNVPRHELVPCFHTQDTTGAWTTIDADTDREAWLDAVYSNTPLITALRFDVDPPQVLSSSSQPGLMTRMLETLDIRDAHRVLEIGTGTGYNAALLTHRLGAHNVFSIDIEPDLVDLARTRLAHLGHSPALVTGDGAHGLPEHAPYDRIIATCAVPAIPWEWLSQVSIDGIVLADLKIAHGAGNLVRLTRTGPDRATGRFDPTYAAFMGLRHHTDTPDSQNTRAAATTPAHRRTTSLDPRTPWTAMVTWFLAALDLGPTVSIGYTGPDTTTPPTAVTLSTPDGSRATIDLNTTSNGEHQVTETGPRRLWSTVESAHHQWNRLDRPGWRRFGLTVTTYTHTLWLDTPDNVLRTWPQTTT